MPLGDEGRLGRRATSENVRQAFYLSNGAFHLSSDIDQEKRLIALKNQLIDALLATYDLEDFELMLGRIGKEVSDFAGPNDTRIQVVSKAVKTAEMKGWLPDLVGRALEDSPGSDELQRFIKDYPEYNPAPPPQQVSNIVGAISKTQEMLKDDLIIFRDNFQDILGTIDILSDYKVLHDSLHDINYGIFSEVERETARLPETDAKNNLRKLDLRLSALIEEMRKAVKRGKVEPEESEWVEELDAARRGLKDALKDYDKDLVGTHKQTIANVLETRPTEINGKLLQAIFVENSRLPKLVGIMKRVRDAMKEIEAEAANVPHFEQAITSLESLISQLKSLVEEHDTWQDVEGKLKQTGEWLETDLPKFSKKWETLRAKIKPYYSGKSEEWATDFQQDDASLEDVIRRGTAQDATPEMVSAARAEALIAFQAYYDKAKWRFFDVDKQLLDKCATLRDISKDLPLKPPE